MQIQVSLTYMADQQKCLRVIWDAKTKVTKLRVGEEWLMLDGWTQCTNDGKESQQLKRYTEYETEIEGIFW